ncbi:MAG: hypothetical protein ACI4JA_04005 [Oscillospiraceae bacterium]
MNIQSVIILLIVLICAALALKHIFTNKKTACGNCSGCCEKCVHKEDGSRKAI